MGYGRLVGAAIAACTTAVLTLPGTALAGTVDDSEPSTLALEAMSFDARQADVTAGPAMVTLTWTVTDADAAATKVRGRVILQQFAGAGPVGAPRTVSYSLTYDVPATVHASSGDARRSTYSYGFWVPRYGPADEVTWRVSEVTATDDRDGSLTLDGAALSGYHAELLVKELVDSSPAQVDYVDREPRVDYLYASGSPITLTYTVHISDQEAGFWEGRLFLAGPGNAKVSTPLRIVDTGYSRYCGASPVYGDDDVWCEVNLTLPADAPSGTWSVSAVVVTDNAGNEARITDVPRLPLGTTRNDVLSASGFAVDPAVVNNWRDAQMATLSMKPAGVRDGITSVTVVTDYHCYQTDTVPTLLPDGTVTVPIRVLPFWSSWINSCAIHGIALTDGAGDLAVYGQYYQGPPLDLVIRRVPDVTPPVALSATLRHPTVPASQTYVVALDVVVDTTLVAPVTQYSMTVYDARGWSVGGGSGGISAAPDGSLVLAAWTYSLAPGTYTVGFTLTDAGDLYTQYGYPGGVGQPAPSGPLVLTVTEG